MRDTENKDKRESFLKARTTGIGGSDAAVILGLVPRKSPLQLWAEKTGALSDDFEATEQMEWGNTLEPVVLAEYSRRRKIVTVPVDDDTMYRHPEHDFMIAHIDAWQSNGADSEAHEHAALPDFGGQAWGITEAKTTGERMAILWADQAPLLAQVQLQHYLATLNKDSGTVVGLIGGQKMLWYDYDKNQKFINAMIEAEARFWEKVKADIPPIARGSDNRFIDLIVKPKPKTVVHFDGSFFALDVERVMISERMSEIAAEKKALEARRAEIDAKIKQEMGDNETGVLADGTVYEWTQNNRKEFTVKAKTGFKLKRKGVK